MMSLQLRRLEGKGSGWVSGNVEGCKGYLVATLRVVSEGEQEVGRSREKILCWGPSRGLELNSVPVCHCIGEFLMALLPCFHCMPEQNCQARWGGRRWRAQGHLDSGSEFPVSALVPSHLSSLTNTSLFMQVRATWANAHICILLYFFLQSPYPLLI